MRLWHQAQQLPPVHNRRAIIQLAVVFNRHAGNYQGIFIRGKPAKLSERFGSRAEQYVGIKQITAGITRDAKLRQHQQIDTRGVSLLNALLD